MERPLWHSDQRSDYSIGGGKASEGRLERLAVIVVGLWLVERATTGYACLLIGIAVLALAIPRCPKTESYGGWDRYVS